MICALVLGACASLPVDYPREESRALKDTGDTRLGRTVTPSVNAHPGLSGVHPLVRGTDAFVARLVLAAGAERGLDVQYYIWRNDTTGRVLLDHLLGAADRGVRVRLLIDDLGTVADDVPLLFLDGHSNIEVRLFNPIAARRTRALGTLADFGRVNRRMHNKSFTADNQVTIVGGRNIGDEYFEARPDLDFGDLDVMAVGPVVQQVSDSFDQFWNSASAYRLERGSGDSRSSDPRRKLEWVEHNNDGEVRYGAEPQVGAWRRLGVWFMSWLPIESQL